MREERKRIEWYKGGKEGGKKKRGEREEKGKGKGRERGEVEKKGGGKRNERAKEEIKGGAEGGKEHWKNLILLQPQTTLSQNPLGSCHVPHVKAAYSIIPGLDSYNPSALQTTVIAGIQASVALRHYYFLNEILKK